MMKHISILLTHHHRDPTPDIRPATRDTRHPTLDPLEQRSATFGKCRVSFAETNGALYERSNNKKVLVHTHIHIFTLPDNFALDLAGFLLPAVERHTRLVIALSDEIVFLACSDV
jgi:hypothetical protein